MKRLFFLFLFLILSFSTNFRANAHQSKESSFEINQFEIIKIEKQGIPSADEVNSIGVEVGDMQARLLKKIEELTLHLIELKKENEEIKKILKEK